jgi:hypothetical protein
LKKRGNEEGKEFYMLQIRFDWKKADTKLWTLRAFRECLGTIVSGMTIEGKLERFDQFLADCSLNGAHRTFETLEEAKAWVAHEIQEYCQEKEIPFCEREGQTMSFQEIVEELKQGKTVKRLSSSKSCNFKDFNGELCPTRAEVFSLADFEATDWVTVEEQE